ncbi:hypothetical protein KQI89_04955 [Clostridium sp. MSJ-4]|uniref:Uncharacterized protein n=1 Tax=Clostridium simiarum TaxID=2841506 RepID=A0ABS6EY03_9CLOT|nr:hypothetical protein [Clostridium simiarum]MBU5591105.1 hypothetical protein [Clostridium simiarum]
MEFRLNKIDNDLRDKINEQTREGKVHSKKDIAISKETNEEGRRGRQQWQREKSSKEKFSLSKYVDTNKKISVNAVKVEDIKVDATIDDKDTTKEIYKGRFLDIRK